MRQCVSVAILSFAFLSCAGLSKTIDEVAIKDFETGVLSKPCKIEKVTIEYDRYTDPHLSTQVRDMLGIKLANAGFTVDGSTAPTLLSLEISQRSFIEGITVQNAIYATLLLQDEAGKELGRISRYMNTSSSVLSPITLSGIVDSLVKGLGKAR